MKKENKGKITPEATYTHNSFWTIILMCFSSFTSHLFFYNIFFSIWNPIDAYSSYVKVNETSIKNVFSLLWLWTFHSVIFLYLFIKFFQSFLSISLHLNSVDCEIIIKSNPRSCWTFSTISMQQGVREKVNEWISTFFLLFHLLHSSRGNSNFSSLNRW